MTFETHKIGDIASITTGLVVKRKQAEMPGETVKKYRMLTLKSFDQDGWLNLDNLECFGSSVELDEKYLTQEGDVIIRLSHPNTAIVIDARHKGLLIPSLFAVVRLESDVLMSEYLSIYLNTDIMKLFYERSAVGTTIQIIKTSMLRDIIIRFPALEQQKRIVEINRLILREKELYSKLSEEKTKYSKEIIKQLLTGGIHNGN